LPRVTLWLRNLGDRGEQELGLELLDVGQEPGALDAHAL
jgi:hypothetical protein